MTHGTAYSDDGGYKPRSGERINLRIIPCPECKAEVDQPCVSNQGVERHQVHTSRKRMATRAFQETLSDPGYQLARSSTGDQRRRARGIAGLRIDDLADLLGIQSWNLRAWEEGRNHPTGDAAVRYGTWMLEQLDGKEGIPEGYICCPDCDAVVPMLKSGRPSAHSPGGYTIRTGSGVRCPSSGCGKPSATPAAAELPTYSAIQAAQRRLVTRAMLARHLKVQYQTLLRWSNEVASFPKPVAKLETRDGASPFLISWHEVRSWLAEFAPRQQRASGE